MTHGAKPAQSGKWFNALHYETDRAGLIDYESVERLAKENKPKLIIAGGSAYSRIIDLKIQRNLYKVGAYLLVDIAHFSGWWQRCLLKPNEIYLCSYLNHS